MVDARGSGGRVVCRSGGIVGVLLLVVVVVVIVVILLGEVLLRHGAVYMAAVERGLRRRRGGWLPIGMAVEVAEALLLDDAFARGSVARLMSLVVRVRLAGLLPRYHRRRCAGERAVLPGRLDC